MIYPYLEVKIDIFIEQRLVLSLKKIQMRSWLNINYEYNLGLVQVDVANSLHLLPILSMDEKNNMGVFYILWEFFASLMN